MSESPQKRAQSNPGSELLHEKKRAASGQEYIYFVSGYSSLANRIKRIRLQTGFLAKVIPFSGKFLPSVPIISFSKILVPLARAIVYPSLNGEIDLSPFS